MSETTEAHEEYFGLSDPEDSQDSKTKKKKKKKKKKDKRRRTERMSTLSDYLEDSPDALKDIMRRQQSDYTQKVYDIYRKMSTENEAMRDRIVHLETMLRNPSSPPQSNRRDGYQRLDSSPQTAIKPDMCGTCTLL